MARQTFRPPQAVVQQGDVSAHIHIVESGCFEVYIWDELLRIERPLPWPQSERFAGSFKAFARSETGPLG